MIGSQHSGSDFLGGSSESGMTFKPFVGKVEFGHHKPLLAAFRSGLDCDILVYS